MYNFPERGKEVFYLKLFKKVLAGALALSLTAGALGSVSAIGAANIPEAASEDSVIERLKKLTENVVLDDDPLRDELGIFDGDPSFPEKFDLRNVDGVNYVTPVKDQGGIGGCWIFGAVSAMETSILYEMRNTDKKDIDASKLDLSELQMLWFGMNHLPETGKVPFNQYGEGLYSAAGFEYGGCDPYAANLLARGTGPVYEEEVPYRNHSGKIYCGYDENGNPIIVTDLKDIPEGRKPSYYYYTSKDHDDWSVDEKYRFLSNIELEEAFILTEPIVHDYDNNFIGYDEAGRTAMKEALMNGYAIRFSYHADNKFLNKKNYAHYTYDNDLLPDHTVCVVGWDDTYSKDNFNQGTSATGESMSPPGDGAWIVKNSWGSLSNEFPNNWGVDGSGYFYLSYYDKSCDGPEAYNFDTSTFGESKERTILQYDFALSDNVEQLYGSDEMSYANVYKAKENYFVRSIGLETLTPGTDVSVKVYKLNKNYTDPTDGTVVAEDTLNYRYGGYHRYDLPEQIQLDINDSISVVVTEKAGENYLIPLNEGASESSYPECYIKAVINRGESYAKFGDSWVDWRDEVNFLDIEDPNWVIDNHMIKVICDPNPDGPDIPVDPEEEKPVMTVGKGGEYANISAAVAAINADIKAKKAEVSYSLKVLSDISEDKAITLPAVPMEIIADGIVTVTMKNPSFTAKSTLCMENIHLTGVKKAVTLTAKDMLLLTCCSVGSIKGGKTLIALENCIVPGKITTSGDLYIRGNVGLTGSISNSSKTAFIIISGNALVINGDLTVSGYLLLEGDIEIKGKLNIKGPAEINGIRIGQ